MKRNNTITGPVTLGEVYDKPVIPEPDREDGPETDPPRRGI